MAVKASDESVNVLGEFVGSSFLAFLYKKSWDPFCRSLFFLVRFCLLIEFYRTFYWLGFVVVVVVFFFFLCKKLHVYGKRMRNNSFLSFV